MFHTQSASYNIKFAMCKPHQGATSTVTRSASRSASKEGRVQTTGRLFLFPWAQWKCRVQRVQHEVSKLWTRSMFEPRRYLAPGMSFKFSPTAQLKHLVHIRKLEDNSPVFCDFNKCIPQPKMLNASIKQDLYATPSWFTSILGLQPGKACLSLRKFRKG